MLQLLTAVWLLIVFCDSATLKLTGSRATYVHSSGFILTCKYWCICMGWGRTESWVMRHITAQSQLMFQLLTRTPCNANILTLECNTHCLVHRLRFNIWARFLNYARDIWNEGVSDFQHANCTVCGLPKIMHTVKLIMTHVHAATTTANSTEVLYDSLLILTDSIKTCVL